MSPVQLYYLYMVRARTYFMAGRLRGNNRVTILYIIHLGHKKVSKLVTNV
jgi:hypothetical protein